MPSYTGPLLVDVELRDPLISRGPVGQWLRSTEQSLRNLLCQVQAVAGGGDTAYYVQNTVASLTEFLDDPTGELWRALKRPGRHLEAGMPARDILERRVQTLRERAQRSLMIHREYCIARDRLRALQETYEPDLPALLASYIAMARLTSEQLRQMRRPEDMVRAQRRLTQIDQTLTVLREVARGVRHLGLTVPKIDVQLTLHELRVLRGIALSHRNQRIQLDTLVRNATVATAEGVIQIGHAVSTGAGWSTGRSVDRDSTSPVTLLIEDEAVRTLSVHSGMKGETAAFWSGTLIAASRGLSGQEGAFQWKPMQGALATRVRQIDAESTAITSEPSQIPCCIPLGNNLVLFTTAIASPIRLFSMNIAVGTQVECTIDQSAAGEIEDFDILPFFSGFDSQHSRWYSVTRRTKIEVLHGDGTEWYGKIISAGTLEVIRHPPADATHPTVQPAREKFRVLRRSPIPEEYQPGGKLEVSGVDSVALLVKVNGPALTGFGMRTQSVFTPFREHPVAMLRSTPIDAQQSRRVWREYELFRALAKSAHRHAVMHAVGLAAYPGGKRLWPCYAIHRGQWPPRAELHLNWIREDSENVLTVLRSAAQLIQAAHAAGFTLGTLSLHQFAYGIHWEVGHSQPFPDPILITAPCATKIGQAYLPISDRVLSEMGTYDTLGCSIIPPHIANEEPASETGDALVFAAFVLDLMFDNIRSQQIDGTSWDFTRFFPELEAMSFSPRWETAHGCLEVLAAPQAGNRLLRGIHAIAHPESTLASFTRAISV